MSKPFNLDVRDRDRKLAFLYADDKLKGSVIFIKENLLEFLRSIRKKAR